MKLLQRILRHILIYITMPIVNFLSRRAYIQYRPDGCSKDLKQIFQLQRIWERGCLSNHRGDYVRLYFFKQNIEMLQKNKIEGAFAELGVYKGNTAKLLLELAPNRELYLFDTFSGFPQGHITAETPDSSKGDYAASFEEVSRYLGENPRVHYCKGVFPETSREVPPDVRFALVHLDCDLYEPTKNGLEFFYPRMVPGGIIILHDYKSRWDGVTRAVDEFFAHKPERLVRIPDKSGTAALIKSLKKEKAEGRARDVNMAAFQVFTADMILDTIAFWARVLVVI